MRTELVRIECKKVSAKLGYTLLRGPDFEPPLVYAEASDL